VTEPFILKTVEVHAEGEAGRVVTNAGHLVLGDTMTERFDYAMKNLDWLRFATLREPRGNPSLCGALIMPPTKPEADFGMIVMEHGNFTAMSGSNTMCVVTGVLETGIVEMHEPYTDVTIDTAVGLVKVRAHCKDGKVLSVSIDNVASWAVELDHILDIPGYGKHPVDLVFGGQFFAQTDVANFGLEVDPKRGKELTRLGAAIRIACLEQLNLHHPENPNLTNVNLVMLHNGDRKPGKQSANAVVLTSGKLDKNDESSWTGVLDRSPCGTGTSGRMAALHARGQLEIGEEFSHHSILGGEFIGLLKEEVDYHGQRAVMPNITGRAWVTGVCEWRIHPTDPFPQGYTLSDIWPPQA
jgi:proline racemase